MSTTFNPVETIRRKRDGRAIEPAELAAFLRGVAVGEVPDYQAAAFLMAVYFQGMTPAETAEFTRQMLLSGRVLAWPDDGRPVLDKHSTGGVGDKVSLPLAPLLACCDCRVPMISGRGLGATGGTLDKLEAIPGFRCQLEDDEFQQLVDRVGCAIVSASAQLAPADKRLYALRDVTATVPSIPLITGSILSKKLAAGLQALVLDVKWGTGAFMKSLTEARALAESLVRVGREMRLATVALVTDMNQPLGRFSGHGIEIDETVAILQGDGPADVVELTLALGAEVLVAAGCDHDLTAARQRLQSHLESGTGYEKFAVMVAAQGGDISAPRPIAAAYDIVADADGYLAALDGELLGRAIAELGGGRRQVTDKIDPSVGLEMLARIGDRTVRGQPIVRIFAHSRGRDLATELVRQAIRITPDPVTAPALIVDRLAG